MNQLVDYVPAEGENNEPHNEVANLAEIEAWIMKDTQAQMLIYTNIEPQFQVSIEGSADAHEMWSRLLAEYASVSTSNVRLILGKFHSYKMNPGMNFFFSHKKRRSYSDIFSLAEHSVSTHINVYRQLAEELRNVGEPQTDNMVISKCLETLPPSFSCIDTVWSNTPAANQTMSNFIAKVTEEERKIKERNNGVESPQDTAFFATHPSRAKAPNLALAAQGQGKKKTKKNTEVFT